MFMKPHYLSNQDENVNCSSCVSVDSEAGVWAVTQDMTVSGPVSTQIIRVSLSDNW